MRHAMMTGPEVLRKHKTVFQVKKMVMIVMILFMIMILGMMMVLGIMMILGIVSSRMTIIRWVL